MLKFRCRRQHRSQLRDKGCHRCADEACCSVGGWKGVQLRIMETPWSVLEQFRHVAERLGVDISVLISLPRAVAANKQHMPVQDGVRKKILFSGFPHFGSFPVSLR